MVHGGGGGVRIGFMTYVVNFGVSGTSKSQYL